MSDNSLAKPWMRTVLRIAAVYNILWGAWVVLAPQSFFELAGMELINHPTVWQGMGMVIGVYGLAYWWASFDPIGQWPIVMVGFLGKIFGPIGFVWNYFTADLPVGFGITLPTNDLIWWVPFFLILRAGYQTHGFKVKS